MKKLVLLVMLLLWVGGSLAQQTNLRYYKLLCNKDSISIDSLSIIPGTFEASYSTGFEIPDTLFELSELDAILYPSPFLQNQSDSITLRYRVFPLKFTQRYQHLEPGSNSIDPLIKKTFSSRKQFNPINPSGSSLYTSGDLSRGIQIGNNQDASLNSNLNLQLSGKISPNFNIEAQLSDATIPIQPEGNTQQIQDFDRLYIRIFNAKTQLLAGDFVLDQTPGYFMKMNKNLQGVQLKTSLFSKQSKKNEFTTRTTAAVVKGKFHRVQIQGIEGNQGPYRLQGNQGEQYIQVIAGSEKVYIDGKLIMRGENEDYTINYNTAEVSFTPRNLITKDKRITIQFEYTERSYARFVVASDNQWKTKNGIVYFNLYSESDAKNQPLLQELSLDQKSLLAQIGDQLDQAQVKNYYETNFQNDRVLYKLVDTLVDGESYSNVLVHSLNPDSAKYQAGFANVGQNNGDYIPIQTSANGQVYKWLSPVNGIPQGSHEPLTRLVSPKKKQVYSLGAMSNLGKRMTIKNEISFSTNDINTFSNLDREDNHGTGLWTRIDRSDKLNSDSTLILNSFFSYRRTGKQYSAIEPFKSIEFERDWNIDNSLVSASENLLQFGINVAGNDSLRAGYTFDWLNYVNQYQANKHNTQGLIIQKGIHIRWNASLLQSNDDFRNTQFLRHELSLAKDWRNLRLELSEKQEGNQWFTNNSQSYLEGSFKFQEWQAQLSNPANDNIPWFIKLKLRSDYAPDTIGFAKNFQAIESSAGLNFKGKAGNSSRFSANWRKLDHTGSESIIQKEENTATIRAEEQFQLSRGAIVSRTFYEIGSGLERKQDFYYLQVPQGQGYYTWADYNGNNVKELNEFEPAVFADQANYIRVFRPGTDYVPVFTNRFTQTVSLNPGRIVKSQESKFKFLNLFNNQFSYNANRRNSRSDFLSTMNPFHIEDSLIVSSQNQLRNRLTFNTSNRKFGLDYVIEEVTNQNLMTYGTDTRNNQSHNMILRWHLADIVWVNNRLRKEKQEFNSDFFTTRNYQLDVLRNTMTLTLESSNQTRINLEWNWSSENNLSGLENLKQHKFIVGGDYQSPGKGLIHVDFQYINLQFEGTENSPVGYVMLKGFRPGNNGMANLSFRRKLNDVIQLDLTYGARLSENSSIIHTGNISVRAVF